MSLPRRHPDLGPLDLPRSSRRLGTESPTTPHTPLTPPLTPSSTLDNSIHDPITATNSNLSTPPPTLPSSTHLLRITKPHLPRIDTLKILVDSESSYNHTSPTRYDLTSPTLASLTPSAVSNGDHFVMLDGVPQSASYYSLRQRLQHLKGLNRIQTKHLISHGVIVLAFDDSRDATTAYSELVSTRGTIFHECPEKPVVTMCSVDQYQDFYGASTTAVEIISELTVIVELGPMDAQLQRSLDEELYKVMESGGTLRSFKKMSSFESQDALVYLIDYFKSSSANHVLSAVNGHSISFAGSTGKIKINKSQASWCKQSSESSQPVNEKLFQQTLYLAHPERSESLESFPTLNRRHSTTSFQLHHNSASPTAIPEQETLTHFRKLIHSVSEKNLRKKCEEDDQSRSSPGSAPHVDADDQFQVTQDFQNSAKPSSLSPLAQPFALRQHTSPFPPSPDQNDFNEPVYDLTPYHHHAAPYSGHDSHRTQSVGVDPYYGLYFNNQTSYGRDHHQIFSLGSPMSSTAHSSPASGSPSTALGTNFQGRYVDARARRDSYDSMLSDHSPNVNISHGLASPASSNRFKDSPSNANHGIPPRNALDLNKIERGEDTRTTVMVKNIPNKMSDRDLIQFIGNVCPRKIDFLYLRMDFTNHCNVGYAFVNFMEVADLLHFARQKLGTKWNMFSSEKVLQMSYANYQGKEALVEKFKNSCIMNEREGWRPKIFYSFGEKKGLPELFPSPTHIRRVERGQQSRGPLWGSNGPPESPDDVEGSSSLRPPRSGLWTRLRLSQGENSPRRNPAPLYNPAPRHVAAARV